MSAPASSSLDLTLYLVTSSDNLSPGSTVESTVEAAIKGGVTVVQLREKQLPTREFLKRAIALRDICHSASPKVSFIVNDRIDIALASGADGVHLGQEDMPIETARNLLGPNAIIGISTNTIIEAIQAVTQKATYIGIGTCWPTSTKVISDHKIIGPRGVKKIRDELFKQGFTIPAVTIGGVKTSNLCRTLHGCTSTLSHSSVGKLDGVAVVSAIMSSSQPQIAARQFRELIDEYHCTLVHKNQKFYPERLLLEGKGPYIDYITSLIGVDRSPPHHQLIHHITNTVVQNDCANLTLALKCSPIMSSNSEEVEELVEAVPGCLILNLGTLEQPQIEAMKIAGRAANRINKPIVCDPVGVGASRYRKKITNQILNDVQVSIIKGNQGEIATLAEESGATTCGVDTMGFLPDPGRVVRDLARKERCIVAMTGPIDYVSDGVYIAKLENGVGMLSSITGSGCMTGSAIGCFAALTKLKGESACPQLAFTNPTMINSDLFAATIAGISSLNIAAELAVTRSTVNGPVSLRAALIDELYHLTESKIKSMIKISLVTTD
ncbi:hypothetical protein CROQUDRAFT_653198 [Cronartium quercuum f. sp. fusiforme G11]|uniref:Thiamine phosphate synthase/TenI domain-containing protein n=1 Tax=Cronartium quercuum f. sp. fusiforme G11 TaxID=708437 RepID=A0A9P6NMK2_9BASI|nr:hypothetical protein CROQUDRAFT_653198 [Cronartium quercuum f. sp. fusiforme G11]